VSSLPAWIMISHDRDRDRDRQWGELTAGLDAAVIGAVMLSVRQLRVGWWAGGVVS
jgi:hypothetical protein